MRVHDTVLGVRLLLNRRSPRQSPSRNRSGFATRALCATCKTLDPSTKQPDLVPAASKQTITVSDVRRAWRRC